MTDSDVLKALNHPVRRKVMAALDEGIASPKELAGLLGLTIPNVSYHVGILRNLGLIKVVRETPRRGAIERHYKATARTLSVRQVLDWVLASDQSRPRGWEAKVVALDAQGRAAVQAAIEKLWKDVERAEQQSARRLGRAADEAGERLAVGTWVAPAVR
ncbi:MAG: transcriptional regulator, ArsR family [Solirubrobacteraceae bacterium]|nr:transcriptional regulator, ArsR family [Solirubrobacteraceae bacterium]